MFNDLARLDAKWFYTWADHLPKVDIAGWTLGERAASGGIETDRTLRLDGPEGWATQNVSLTGGGKFNLSFNADADQGATGGVFVEYLDSLGNTAGSAFATVNGDGNYLVESGLTATAKTARVLFYSSIGGVDFDDVSIRVDGVETVANGTFETIATGSKALTGSFIPMIWGRNDIASASTVIASVPAILTFNEPDNADQANMSVAEGLAAWPDLMKSGVRLGSPATTMENTLGNGSWLQRFMTGADAKGYRVDFIAVHYYPENGDVEAFRDFLQDVYDAYKRPIWVTEWALADWDHPNRFTAEEQGAFFEAATQMMDDLPFVEKQAWFATREGLDGWRLNSALIDDQNGLTVLGQQFAALAASQTTPVAPPDPLPAPAPTANWIHGTTGRDAQIGTDGNDIFVFDQFGKAQRDTISGFGHDDLLATSAALKDGNGDGLITFGRNKVLDLSDIGGDTVQVEGLNPARGLRALGEQGGLFYYGDATVRPKNLAGRAVVEGTVGDDTISGERATTTFFFDTALGIGTGHDTLKGFSAKSLLVTTTAIEDVNSGVVNTHGDGFFELGSSASTVLLLDDRGGFVDALEFDGSVKTNGVTYYVYSAVHAALGMADFIGG